MSTVDFRIVDTADAAAEEAAALIADAAGAGGHIGLSGGSGPRPAYERAGVLQADWGSVELWWIDDRCVPPADGRSNYRMIRESLLDGLSRPPERPPDPGRAHAGGRGRRVRRRARRASRSISP